MQHSKTAGSISGTASRASFTYSNQLSSFRLLSVGFNYLIIFQIGFVKWFVWDLVITVLTFVLDICLKFGDHCFDFRFKHLFEIR